MDKEDTGRVWIAFAEAGNLGKVVGIFTEEEHENGEMDKRINVLMNTFNIPIVNQKLMNLGKFSELNGGWA